MTQFQFTKRIFWIAITLSAAAIAAENEPQFNKDNELIRPTNYREWIFVTSGNAMSYGAGVATSENPPFDNVFVRPDSYRAFMQTGKWPDKTIFILEIRESAGNASINKAGHFQTGLLAIEAAVKDEARYKEKWAYFGFGRGDQLKNSVKAFLATDRCYACHVANAAVENTFVQFYPTLLKVAEAKGTLNANYH